MTTHLDSATKKTLESLLATSGLSRETRLYRSTQSEFLQTGKDPGALTLSANAASAEAVVDVYGGGHIVVAEQVGPGLAFAEQRANQWRAPGRSQVEVRLGDVLDQGGLVYPVESVVTEKVWYLTLPRGAVRVREVAG
jgi:hypothetical protein